MYEARFTTKQVYDNYAKSVSKPKSYTPAKSRSLGAFEPDPAQRNTTTRSTYTPPTRRNTKKNKGSTYDEVPQVLTQSIVQRPKPKPTKETGYQKVTRIFNDAMSGFGDFEVPTQPTFDTVKPQNLYKDNRYFGPQVYTPDTSQFGRGYEKKYFLGMELPTGSPSLPRSLKRSNVNIFGNTKDHPRLNMFGVKRSYTRNPDSLMAPPTMSKPEINFDDRTELLLGTRNAVARALDFVEDSDPQTTIITSQHTVEKGESLLSIIEDFNRDKPDKEKVTLEEVGELNNIPNVVADPFGKVEKGDVLQIPVKKETAVQVLRQEIERERKVKKELLEFKRLSGEQKIKVLKEKGIIPKESIQKISDIGELSPEVEAELEDILLALEEGTGLKKDLTDLSQAGERDLYQSGVPIDQRIFEPELGEGMENVVGYDDVPQMVTGLMSKTNIVKENFDTSDVESSRISYESVKKVQKRLNDLGYTTLMGDLKVDGQLGPGTARQLRKFQAEAGLPTTAASGQPVDEATLKALKDNRFNNKEGKDRTAKVTSLQDGMFNIVKPIIADIESGGEVARGRNPYLVAGGSGRDYDGKYQIGRDAKDTLKNMRDEDGKRIFTAAEIVKLDHDNNRADFRGDSALQEKAFRQLTEFNHSELTKNSQKYRDMDEGNKLAVLGYAHNQGAEAALEWLSTQVVGTDAFGTRGDKYSKAITDEFMKDDNLG